MTHDGDWDELETDFDEENDSEIQALLDMGYEQLDGFAGWMETFRREKTRLVQQDCYNVEMLIDYLANQHTKSAADCNEFEMRWFVFSHYIRKTIAEPETELRLLDSLRNFYDYLQAEHSFTPKPWLYAVLEARPFFFARHATWAELDSEDERQWEEGYTAWCQELEDDLDTRCLWLPNELGAGMAWGDVMGWREATLREQANQFWQTERENLMREGLDCESARPRLLSELLFWLDTPQDRLDGQTPRDVIVEEQAEIKNRQEDEDE